jgi:recombination protein RecA
LSHEGELLALGEKYGLVHKSGASYSYGPSSANASAGEEVKLGRGYDASRTYLRENKPVAKKLLKEIREKLKEQ